jgi:hypothetical protein
MSQTLRMDVVQILLPDFSSLENELYYTQEKDRDIGDGISRIVSNVQHLDNSSQRTYLGASLELPNQVFCDFYVSIHPLEWGARNFLRI